MFTIKQDLNRLGEAEHNRVFASETQRMMGVAHQVRSAAPKIELSLCGDSVFLFTIKQDLNRLGEAEHNRVFASETQRMMGVAHQVRSAAPKNPECESIQDFYLLPLTSSLLPKLHSGFFGK
ncbi:MAG: hypothetical protein IIX14_03560 [Clostridia bacterium]|nr:hypothetical protein [Clostridia bacterium]